ncbi:MAG: sarcosine oxidase subunit gamma family protein [Pseudomonadota bacterium]
MPDNTVFASPLIAEAPDGPASAEGPQLRLVERRDVGMVLIRGKRENPAFVSYFESVLGVSPPGERLSVEAQAFSIVRMGRTDYLISGEIKAIEDFARQAEAAAEGAPCIAAEITHGRIVIDMKGPGAVTVLAKSCGLDLRPSAFPVGLGTRTRFADTLAYVERRAADSFRLVSDRATGAFFWAWLKDAGSEFLT